MRPPGPRKCSSAGPPRCAARLRGQGARRARDDAGGDRATDPETHARRRRVARLKGGDPFVFGRGGEELQTLAAHGIPCTVIPGITAALGAAASAGIPLTHRQLAGSVTFVTGHSAGGEEPDWSALARPGQTVVFYMGIAQLAHITGRLRAAGAPASRPVALIERATLPGERQLHGTLADIGPRANDAAITPPALLIVGDVAALAASAIPPSRSLDVRLRSVA
ncbi:MAG: uroporphyrinogen-III C-methyltransferase [Gammaproteobacteria bacterium]|nr:uroporphyrinogen-III C-methyltransferase [Gammaproteobacteria bacterium]